MKKISLLDYLIRFLCQYLGKKRHFNRRLGLTRNQSGIWTLWIFLGKLWLIVKKNGTWVLLDLCLSTRAFTIETGFPRFPGFRVHFWTPIWQP